MCASTRIHVCHTVHGPELRLHAICICLSLVGLICLLCGKCTFYAGLSSSKCLASVNDLDNKFVVTQQPCEMKVFFLFNMIVSLLQNWTKHQIQVLWLEWQAAMQLITVDQLVQLELIHLGLKIKESEEEEDECTSVFLHPLGRRACQEWKEAQKCRW